MEKSPSGLKGHVINLDWSARMLESRDREHATSRIIGDATNMPFRPESIDVLIASLAAPFNVRQFWDEALRALRYGGFLLYTTPSYEWSRRDRNRDSSHHLKLDQARWLTKGSEFRFSSIVLPVERQVEMIESAGLNVKSIRTISQLSESGHHPPFHEKCEVTLFDCTKTR